MIPCQKFWNKKVFTLVQVLKDIDIFIPNNEKGAKKSEKIIFVISPEEKYDGLSEKLFPEHLCKNHKDISKTTFIVNTILDFHFILSQILEVTFKSQQTIEPEAKLKSY